MTTPRLGAPELTSGQAAPETTVNEQIRYVEAFAGAHFMDRDLTAPPGSPADGDCYLVKATATGAWSGKDGKIALYVNTSWVFITAKEGFSFWVDDEDIQIIYDGSAWNVGAGGASESSDAQIWAASDATTRISPRRVVTAGVSQALTDGATITPDFGAGFNFHVTLGGNRTLANPTNIKAGQAGRIRIVQDGTGSRTLAYGSAWKFPGGAPTLTTTAAAIDVIAFYCHSTSIIEATLLKNFS